MQETHDAPAPPDQDDVNRWTHTRLRRRMLTGRWADDLLERVKDAVGTSRAIGWGRVDLSSNPFKAVCSQLACLYDRPPTVTHQGSPESAATVQAALEGAGWVSMAQRVQRDTLGLREMLIRADVVVGELDGVARLLLRPVTPDRVIAEGSPDAPDVPIRVEELRRRLVGGVEVWTWEVWDARDGGSRKVLSADRKTDLTSELGLDGPYPYLDNKSRPMLPYVLHHAERTGALWNPFEALELVEGTLQAGINWSHHAHVMSAASWPQRYGLDVAVAGRQDLSGGPGGDSDSVQTIEADPAVVVMFRAAEGSATPSLGQWGAGADVDAMAAAAERYDARVASSAAMAGSDLIRSTGDARSGYALAVSRESKREASARYEPVFGRSDAMLCRLVAVQLNAHREPGEQLVEGGYRIRYEALPLSADERRSILDEVVELLDRGLISRQGAQRRLEGAGIVGIGEAVTPAEARP